MASVFMEKTSSNGGTTYKAVLSYKSKSSRAYDCNINDFEFKETRGRENQNVIFNVAQGLKAMKIEARNGFKELLRDAQLDLISRRKKTVELVLTEFGAFLYPELKSAINRTSRIIDKIYTPNMSKKR